MSSPTATHDDRPGPFAGVHTAVIVELRGHLQRLAEARTLLNDDIPAAIGAAHAMPWRGPAQTLAVMALDAIHTNARAIAEPTRTATEDFGAAIAVIEANL